MKTIIKKTVFGNCRGNKRVWLEGTEKFGWMIGTGVSVDYRDDCLIVKKGGSDRVIGSPSKGGVLDFAGPNMKALWEKLGQPEICVVEISDNTIIIRGGC